MNRISQKKKLSISIFLLLVLIIGIGYAYLTSNLSITGATEVVANTWNIHFENLNVKDGSVTASSPATIQSNNVDITYSIHLSRPKDYYEFTVDVKNDGTLPGKVSISELSGITADASSVIDYSITYINGRTVAIGDILNAGAKKIIKVKVFYKDDISAIDLPSSNINLSLTYTLQYVQSDSEEPTLDTIKQELISNNSSCFTKYIGEVTDEVGQTVTASNVYFDNCADKRNVIFGGYCWQIIRTTETGGIKMIYNGDVVDNKCLSTRSNHKGMISSDNEVVNLNSRYLYGSSFTIDTINNTFTLVDTVMEIWSNTSYNNLISKFTCKNTTGTCTTLYGIGNYASNDSAITVSYSIGNTNYAQIGTSPFNAYDSSGSMVGYMYNKTYKFDTSLPSNDVLFGNDIAYSNGMYTLLPSSSESTLGTTKDATHHYTCNNTTGTCNKVRYYYFYNSDSGYYIELDGEENIDEAVNNMLYDDSVNRYNSSIKGIIDAWYKNNLLDYTTYMENAIFCNNRSINDLGGWDPDGGSIDSDLTFVNFDYPTSLVCPNITDQFSVSNNKAKLTYPIALLQNEEIMNMNNSLRITNDDWWNISPYGFYLSTVGVLGIDYSGTDNEFYVNVDTPNGVRPAISIMANSSISSGTGSESDPWIVE